MVNFKVLKNKVNESITFVFQVVPDRILYDRAYSTLKKRTSLLLTSKVKEENNFISSHSFEADMKDMNQPCEISFIL